MIVFGTKLARVLDVLGEEAHKFSSTQIDIKGDLAEELLGFGKQIDSDDLAGDGLEDRPHITLKYGLHTGDAEDVREVLIERAALAAVLEHGSVLGHAVRELVGDDVDGRGEAPE